MALVIAHAELVSDQTSDPRTAPQRRREAVRLGAFQQQRLEAFELRGVQQRLTAGAAGLAQPGFAVTPVSSQPLADALPRDLQSPRCLGLTTALLDQPDRFETALLQGLEIPPYAFCVSHTYKDVRTPKRCHFILRDSIGGGVCPFCRSSPCEKPLQVHSWSDYKYDSKRIESRPGRINRASCSTCGFWSETLEGEYSLHFGEWYSREVSALLSFDINSTELNLAELGSHLRRRHSDLRFLTPRRFEELVSDIYRNSGYFSKLTKCTRDGGYDIVLLEKSTGAQILVECKRYSASNRVRVGAVRQLLGVQLERGVRKAKLVTTTHFTGPAQATADTVNSGISGYELELVDVDALTAELGVYNMLLPPLSNDSRFR